MAARPPMIILQAIVLVAVGSGIGIADMVRRPITLTRATTPAPPIQTPAPISPPTDTPTTPAPAAPAHNPNAKPGDADWKPTPKAALPAGQITLEEGKALMDSGGAQFIDTRKKDEYEAGHIAGAFRISLTDFRSGDPALLGMIPRTQAVICYCVGGHCDESEAVARMFAGSGYQNVYVLHDGYPGWKAVGYPVETGPGIQAE